MIIGTCFKTKKYKKGRSLTNTREGTGSLLLGGMGSREGRLEVRSRVSARATSLLASTKIGVRYLNSWSSLRIRRSIEVSSRLRSNLNQSVSRIACL